MTIESRNIAAAAAPLFNVVGFHRADLAEVAVQIGISLAELTAVFPTTTALHEAVLRCRDAADLERFTRNWAGGDDGLGAFRGMIDLTAKNGSERGLISLFSVTLAESTSPDHPSHAYFVKRNRRIRNEMEQALQLAHDAGSLVEGLDLRATAIELTALVDGLPLQWLLDPMFEMNVVLRNRIEQLITVDLYGADPHL